MPPTAAAHRWDGGSSHAPFSPDSKVKGSVPGMAAGATALATGDWEGGPSSTSDSNQAGQASQVGGQGECPCVSPLDHSGAGPEEHQFITFAQDPSTNPLAVWPQ